MIAITGASGLLGSFIASKFLSEGEHVIGITRKQSDVSWTGLDLKKIQWREANILDSISLGEILVGVDTVIHSAAVVSFNPRREKEIFDTNVIGTKNVVDACLAAGVKKLIHISSVASLGKKKGVRVINEENTWIESPFNSTYATSKYQAELEVYRGYEEGLEVSIVNPSVILAPSDWNRSSSQLFKYAWDERPFYMQGGVNFVDVRDVVNMVWILSNSYFNGERFIASAGQILFKNLFEEIGTRFGKKPPFIKVGTSLAKAFASFEAVKCFITHQEPILTKETVMLAGESFLYENKKAVTNLKMNFRTLEETLDFCCPFYIQNITTNK